MYEYYGRVFGFLQTMKDMKDGTNNEREESERSKSVRERACWRLEK